MKKLAGVILSLILILCAVSATASTVVQSVLNRNIKINGRSADGSFPNNPLIAGESSTTGLPTGNTVYVPILVQIDNNLASIPQWGIASADIMYELPIAGQGFTRLTALFSDTYPQEAGPVRSGRVMHADLREEWDALLIHYGKQEDPGSDMREALREFGATKKGLAADGIANMYKDYFARVRYHAAPHNVTAYIQKFRDLMLTNGYQFPVRPFKFTDDLNYNGVPALKFNVIHKGNKDTSSSFVYDAASNAYARFTAEGAYLDLLKPEQVLAYSNVIIQRTKLSWNNSSIAPLFNDIVGSGAADIFIGGQYIAGVWARNEMVQRTVFFDHNGNEISLQRGKTWIIICDDTTEVIIGDLDKAQTSLFVAAPASDADPSLAKPFVTVPPAPTVQPTSVPAVPEESKPAATVQPTSVPAVPDESKPVATSTPFLSPEQTLQPQGAVVVPEQSPEAAPLQETVVASTAMVQVGNNGLLNMRNGASKSNNLVTRIPNGSTVEIISRDGEWVKIRFDGIVGYVLSEYLVFDQPQTVLPENTQMPAMSEYSPLKLGDRGDEVTKLKKRLYELGYFRTTNLNNRYMDSTVDAVRNFEKRNELNVDGVADSEMLSVLYSEGAKRQYKVVYP